MPVTRRTACGWPARGTMRRRRGRHCRSNMAFSSCGGPGSSMATPPDSSTHWPGAVPRSLGSTSAPSMTKAWRLFTSAILRFMRAKRASICSAISGWKTSLRSSAWATASRVTSSSVGPRPPERITIGERESARAHGIRQPVAVVADHGFGGHLHAQVVELGGEVERIGVDALGGEHLRADCDDFGVHQKQRQALDADVHAVERVGGGDHQGARGVKARPTMPGPERNSSASRSGVMRTTPLRPPMEAATYRWPVFIERHALRPAQAAIEDFHLAVVGNAVDAIEARGGGAGDVEVAVRTERQMVGGDGRLERGEDEDLAVGADLENGAAAVADVEVVLAVEGDAGGDAHAFHVDRHVAGGRDLVDEAVIAAGDVEQALGIEGQAGGVHQVVEERLHAEVQVDLEHRYRDLLAARSAEGGVDIAEGVDRRIGHRVQVVGDQDADVAGPGFARLLAALRSPARRPWRLPARGR